MSVGNSSSRAFRFGEFVLDLDRGALLKDEQEIRVRPKSFEVLRYLVEHAGMLVSRDELLEAVWSGSIVTDDAVTQCLIDIRKALGDSKQHMIRTVPRRGYILEVDVEPAGGIDGREPGHPPSSVPGRGYALGLLAVAVIAALWWSQNVPPPAGTDNELVAEPVRRNAIAVLPFDDMSPAQDHAYFADGVSEEILNMLARRAEMRVIARTSSFSFRGEAADISTIADRLNVSHVLEGSVRKDGDSLRISVQLIDASSGEYLWTERFDRELSTYSLFAIQSEIATTVARKIPAMNSANFDREQGLPTQSLAALEAYYEGRRLIESRQPEDLDRAADFFRESIRQDPQFALAYVSLATTVGLQSYYGSLSERLAWQLARTAVDRALELDSLLGEAYAELAFLQMVDGDLAAAEASYRRCLELNPNYAAGYQWFGEFLSDNGRAEEAIVYSKIATELDPRSAIIASDYAEVLGASGRHAEALEQFDVALEIDPGFHVAYEGKAWVLHMNLGRVAEAVTLYQSAFSLAPTSPKLAVDLGNAFLDLGDPAAAAAYFEQAVALAPEQVFPEYGLLALQIHKGDKTAAHETARSVLEAVPWAGLALQWTRDRHLANGELDAALSVYAAEYSELVQGLPVAIDDLNFRAAINIAHVLKRMGRVGEADSLLDRLSRYVEERKAARYDGTDIYAIKIRAIRGDVDGAIRLLSKAVEAGWRYRWWYELQYESSLEVLHDQPEFQQVLDGIHEDMARQLRMLQARGEQRT